MTLFKRKYKYIMQRNNATITVQEFLEYLKFVYFISFPKFLFQNHNDDYQIFQCGKRRQSFAFFCACVISDDNCGNATHFPSTSRVSCFCSAGKNIQDDLRKCLFV